MANRIVSLVFVLCLAGCDDDPIPDLVIPSSSVEDASVHMAVYVESKEEQTDVSVYLHRHHPQGYTQYLDLQGGDELTLEFDSWSGELTTELVPTESNPFLSYARETIDSTVAGTDLTLQFLRDGVPLLVGAAELLADSDLSLVADTEAVTMDSVLTASWTAVEQYEYRMHVRFQCVAEEGHNVGFVLTYPESADEEPLLSPLQVDLADFESPPEGATDCEISAKLTAEADQTPEQPEANEPINVFVARSVEQSLPLNSDSTSN